MKRKINTHDSLLPEMQYCMARGRRCSIRRPHLEFVISLTKKSQRSKEEVEDCGLILDFYTIRTDRDL